MSLALHCASGGSDDSLGKSRAVVVAVVVVVVCSGDGDGAGEAASDDDGGGSLVSGVVVVALALALVGKVVVVVLVVACGDGASDDDDALLSESSSAYVYDVVAAWLASRRGCLFGVMRGAVSSSSVSFGGGAAAALTDSFPVAFAMDSGVAVAAAMKLVTSEVAFDELSEIADAVEVKALVVAVATAAMLLKSSLICCVSSMGMGTERMVENSEKSLNEGGDDCEQSNPLVANYE